MSANDIANTTAPIQNISDSTSEPIVPAACSTGRSCRCSSSGQRLPITDHSTPVMTPSFSTAKPVRTSACTLKIFFQLVNGLSFSSLKPITSRDQCTPIWP
jgi:hypothetical protein